MQETSNAIIDSLLKEHRSFFNSQKTKSVTFRLQQLQKLKKAIDKYEKKIEKALWKDLNKSKEEAYLTEISIVKNEIKFHQRNLKGWAKPKSVPTPLQLLPSKSRIHYEPLGVSLIVSPWNYPFQLLINPLIGAISSGCCAMIKPSPDTPTVAIVIDEMISDFFPKDYISVVHGAKETNTHLFSKKFDLIFFTGSPKLGKIVMKAAAENLTPVILELGGKSPSIVDANANLNIAAKRIVWGKFINAGQTCIAPDYLWVHESVKEKLVKKMIQSIKEIYGNNAEESAFYPRIVHQTAMDRLISLLNDGQILYGGNYIKEKRYIQPTLLEPSSINVPIMQEEIFGPILPILTFNEISEVINYINSNEKPLAFYYFGKNKTARNVIEHTTSGGACINDTLMHVANHHLPFGGVGNSGMGNYHGKESFMAFSNKRSMIKTPTWIDVPFKYPPFKYFKWIKKIM